MMDCIFSSHFFTYFVLDLLLWRDYDVRDCDTEFRMWYVGAWYFINSEHVFSLMPKTVKMVFTSHCEQKIANE